MVDFFVEGLPPGPNVKRHHMKVYQDNQDWGNIVRLSAYNQRPATPYPKAHIHYHIAVGDNRAHDADNLISSLKPCQDALKGLVIADDSIDDIEVSYSFSRDKPRGFRIQVTPI